MKNVKIVQIVKTPFKQFFSSPPILCTQIIYNNFSKHAIVSLSRCKGADFQWRSEKISFSIEEKLLERVWKLALRHYEG